MFFFQEKLEVWLYNVRVNLEKVKTKESFNLNACKYPGNSLSYSYGALCELILILFKFGENVALFQCFSEDAIKL